MNKTKYYPVSLNIDNKLCVVVGGGRVAQRKINSLLHSGAKVRLVSPCLVRGVGKIVEDNGIEHIRDYYRSKFLNGAALVIAATDNKAVNEKVAHDAAKRRIPVNVVDTPELCSFIVPAVVRKGDLTISISTNARSPLFAHLLKNKVREMINAEYLLFLRLIAGAGKNIEVSHGHTGMRLKP